MKLRIPFICLVFSVLIIGICLFAMGETAQSGTFTGAVMFGSGDHATSTRD